MLLLYKNIKSRRQDLGMSQTELAKKCGYTDRSSIAKIESGKVDLPQSKIKTFADALGVSAADLMGDVGGDVIPYNHVQKIPILGRIAAGLPIYAEQQIEGYTYTTLNSGAEYFALKVQGDSMTAARINDGDTLIVRRQDEVENGQIAVVMVGDDEATVKRFYQAGSTVTLMPQSTNAVHKPQIYDTKSTPVRVIGLVVQNQIAF